MFFQLDKNGNLGIEISLLSTDPIDFEIHEWDYLGLKILLKIFSLYIYIVGLEVGKDRSSIGILNCFISVFYN